MTDTEITRFLRRRDAFTQHGLPQLDAERLAEQLMRRDRPAEGDNRRVCFECSHLSGKQ